jgi:hypothetical protein
LSDEKIVSLISKHRTIEDHVITNHDKFDSLLKDIIKANTNYKLVKRIQQIIKPKPIEIRKTFLISQDNPLNASVVKYSTTTPPENYSKILTVVKTASNHRSPWGQGTTQGREKAYNVLSANIPLTMTADECSKTLSHLCAILTHSQTITVKRMSNLIPMINHTVLVLSAHGIVPSFDKRVLKCLGDYPDFIYNVYNKVTTTPVVEAVNPLLPNNTTFGPRTW